MIIGVPKEIKTDEYRVGMVPGGVASAVAAGHKVLVEASAGAGSGISDGEYAASGAEIVQSAAEVYDRCDMIVKVKEPQPDEYGMLRRGQVVFTYFHFAASRQLTEAMMRSGAVAIAYETVRDVRGRLPLLIPMSEVAGRMSIQEGAKSLERPMHGRGILLGGVPGVAPASVVVLGAGTVGANAARVAAGLGAAVTLLDVDLEKLRYLSDVMPPNVTTLYSDSHNLRESLHKADLLICSVLIPGAKAPRLVTRKMLELMVPGACIVDVSIDQGGCCETSRPTTHTDPTFVVDEINHYCVTNMPGAVGRTSTFALTNATIPYVLALAEQGWEAATEADPGLAMGVNVANGRLTNEAVAGSLGMKVQ